MSAPDPKGNPTGFYAEKWPGSQSGDGFTFFPNVLLQIMMELNLRPGPQLLMIHLIRWNYSGDGISVRGRGKLSRELGVSSVTIDRWRGDLKEAGLLKVRTWKEGGWRSETDFTAMIKLVESRLNSTRVPCPHEDKPYPHADKPLVRKRTTLVRKGTSPCPHVMHREGIKKVSEKEPPKGVVKGAEKPGATESRLRRAEENKQQKSTTDLEALRIDLLKKASRFRSEGREESEFIDAMMTLVKGVSNGKKEPEAWLREIWAEVEV